MSSHQKKNPKFRPKVRSNETGGSSRLQNTPSRFQPPMQPFYPVVNPYYQPQPTPQPTPQPYYQPYRLDDDFEPFCEPEPTPPQPYYHPSPPQNEPYDDTQQAFEEEEEPTQGRGKGKFANRAKAKPWEEREVLALAKAWIRASEDGEKGDQQTSDSFWGQILANFSALVGGTTRSHHQLNSKWNAINAKITRFNGIYNQMKNRWQSGCSDADIMNKAQREYRTTYDKKGFNLVDAWNELKDRPKWQRISLMGEEFEDDQPNPSKKSKGSESGNDGSNDPLNFQFNLNEESPSGSKLKQRWKKPVGGSSSKGESLTEVVSQYKASKEQEREEKLKIMKEQANRRNERELMALTVLEMQKNLIEKDTEARDWETYIKPHDNLHPALLDHVIRKKRELAEKYGWPVYF